jgi:hypothetical protein
LQAESLAAAGLLQPPLVEPATVEAATATVEAATVEAATAAAAPVEAATRGGGVDEARSSLTGVDVSENLLERARASPGNPYRDHLHKADLNDPLALAKLGFPDDHFDAALCVGVLTYIGGAGGAGSVSTHAPS